MMNKVELSELSKIQSIDNCCLFCQSKCSKCGSVDIEVQYQRFYSIIDEHLSYSKSEAYVFCNNCGIINEFENDKYDFTESAFGDDAEISFQIANNDKYTYDNKIAVHLDSFFYDEKPIKIGAELMKNIYNEDIEDLVLVYEYKNDTRNKIHLSLNKWYSIIDNYDDYLENEISDELYCLFNTPAFFLECKEERENGKAHYILKSSAMKIS